MKDITLTSRRKRGGRLKQIVCCQNLFHKKVHIQPTTEDFPAQ